MLRYLALLLIVSVHLDATFAQFIVPDEPNVLTPPYFNIATGKKIDSTATCGKDEAQVFCKLTGGPNEYEYNENLYQGQFCDLCDIGNPEKAHPIKYAIDGTEKWWQSPPLSQGSEYNRINVTIHLGQVFHVAYVIIKFANSPRAGTWVLERSSDHGNTFQPWQYFANSDSDCHNLFGIDAFEEISRDDSVICTSEYSDVVPLERGEVIVSMINRRPGAKNFSHSPVLQEWSKATDVRIRLLRTKTLLGHLMAVQRQDPTVTRRYFYSIKDISIGGRCVCNGHADTCVPDPNDKYKLKCQCRHNTCGDSCEYCCPKFVQKEWRPAVPENANECELCNCHGHSNECEYNDDVAVRRQSLDIYEIYEGGGVCKNCLHFTTGINCERCIDGYYRPANINPRDHNGCRPYPDWLTFYGPKLEAGLDLYIPTPTAFPRGPTPSLLPELNFDLDLSGDRDIDSKDEEGSGKLVLIDHGGLFPPTDPRWPGFPGHGRPPSHLACNCNSAFTVGTCEPVTGRCYCKPKYAGDRCDRCAPGYHIFPECEPCPCYYNATRDGVCLPVDDVCPCKYNFAGKYCSECAPGFYNFPECVPCTCHGQGAEDDTCDPYSGQCTCAQGFGGKFCDQCSSGYFSYPVCQSCSCITTFTTDQVCDPETGRCFCTDLVTGVSCNQCISGYYDFPKCKECQCSSPGADSDLCDPDTGRCHCKPNFQGDLCDECAPEYYNYPNCIPCDCDVQGSQRTTCDAETGQCTCFTYISGRRCDRCSPDYFNFPRCEDCKCDPRGIKSIVSGVCLAFTTGQCDCKENVIGKYCNMCSPLHYNLTLGCISCNCFLQGTLDGVAACDTDDGHCWCKPYTCSQRCSQCEDGFYGLEEKNYLGCSGCQCDTGGAMTADCNSIDGQCRCKRGVTGRKCDRVEAGYYYPTLLQHQYEIEDGKTEENSILRFGFNQIKFPSFSMKGYGEFSIVQRKIIVPIEVTSHGLYRILFYYISSAGSSAANVTLAPFTATGSQQSYQVAFEPSSVPALMKVKEPFVLNRGQWNVVIEGEPGLLIDYFVLLPSEYYEPGILQAKVTEPCVPKLTITGKECLMYTHPNISALTGASLTTVTARARHDSPSTAHPVMVILDGNSIKDEDKSVSVTLKPHRAGKYVVVLDYASMEDRTQTIEASVSDGAGRTFSNVVFNIYACGYSFLCRQVALTELSDIMVFDISVPHLNIDLSVGSGEKVFVKSVHAIPHDVWTMEYVEPKIKCITREGPEFDSCLDWAYPIPVTSRKFDTDEDDAFLNPVPTATSIDVNAKYLGGDDNTIQIDMDLQPGRYVFLLHYFNPLHLSFSPSVVVSGGPTQEGSANITYCPHGDGCRAVVTSNTGDVVLDIRNPIQTMTITVPKDKNLWLDYVLAIPEYAYNPSHLELMPIDHSRKFFEQCYGIGSEGLINTADDLTEFCRSAVFSLTMDFNDGALPCECSGAGTIGGGDVDCEKYGGQCPCKPNVIGRQCDRCMTGFYGYPDCKPCDCNGSLCDEINGDCICPPNTVSPGCDQCVPFTHSFHPLAGCVSCDCHRDGVENAEDLGCSKEDGQCRCKDTVEGQRCDKCKPGFYGFPACRPCVCNERGSISEGCDPVSGQCICKENVEGQQCDRCKVGTFYLDQNNPLGCTKCFCFGASNECHSTQYPVTEINQMRGWRLLNLNVENPIVQFDGTTATVDIADSGGPIDPNRANLYWAAPKDYLGDMIGSYGGVLRYVTRSYSGGRGDSSFSFTVGDQPAPLTAPAPSLILKGEGMTIGWVNRDQTEGVQVAVNLTEKNFLHENTGDFVKREEMMMVLSSLRSLRIHATDDIDAAAVSIQGVSLTTTDYQAPIGSGPSIPSVEECLCPKGYTGQSCQLCNSGHYREDRGPYLGYCTECECYGHCETCAGELVESDECLHNTAGNHCDKCKEGYIGDAKSGDPDACKPCPCPFESDDGNFAKSCEEGFDGEIICHCLGNYTGERCEQCSLGYFGNPGVINGECVKCNCHNNLDVNLVMEICNPITGECTDCQYNTGGKYCERCADGYYGDALIAKNCTKCPCYDCGTLACDHKEGHCACKQHVIGIQCDRCEPGFFNLSSCNGCEGCKCGIGARSTICNEYSGQCECAPNVVGLKCDRCAPGHWDYSPEGCRPCNCRNNGACNPVNGACKCPPGITGRQCDQCELERHILRPGGLKCEACDSCTHDLLDTIEPMTRQVRGASDKLSQVSVGVAAAKRLEEYERQKDKFLAIINAGKEGMMTSMDDATSLLNGSEFDEIDTLLMASGDNEASGAPVNIVQDTFAGITVSLTRTEVTVTEMCNHTNALLDMTKKSAKRAGDLESNVTKLTDEIDEVEVDAKSLLDKVPEMFMDFQGSADELNEESSGDTDEYLQKLRDAEMLLERMKQRIFKPMKKVANAELAEAKDLFDRVSRDFIFPAGDLEQRANNVSQDLTDKLEKIKELRKLLNNAIQQVTDVATVNAANSKALTTVKDNVDKINAEWKEINQIIEDAQRLLERGAETPEVLTSELLLAAVNDLQVVYEAYQEGLVGMEAYVNQSLIKANMLKSDADTLTRLVEETKNDPRNLRAVEAANRYQTIVNTMMKAKELADKADLDATDAKIGVTDRNLGEAADKAHARSSQLLSETQDMLDRVRGLENDLNNAKKSSEDMKTLTDDLSGKVENVKTGIGRLDHGDVDGSVAEIKRVSAEATAIAAEANNAADDLQAQIDNAPDPNIPVEAELTAVQNILDVLPNQVSDMKKEVQDLTERAAVLARLPGDLGLDEKIKAIKKRITLARSKAESVTVPMRFKKREDIEVPEYVQVHIPPHVFNMDDNLRIEMYVNTSTAGDNSLLYLGDTSAEGDYVALEMVDGLVNYYYKVGSGVGELKSVQRINDEEWHRIVIERMENKGKLEVEYFIGNDGRGDSGSDSRQILVDTKEGETDAGDIKATLPRATTPFVIGGRPNISLPETLTQTSLTGCVRDLTLNNVKIGLWNFISYNGPKPGATCPGKTEEDPSLLWKFRGLDSYLRVSQEQLRIGNFYANPIDGVNFVFRFNFFTVQSDSLLFFVGQTVDQFFALELRGGKFVLTYNFGFQDGVHQNTLEDYRDITTFSQPLILKAGVIPKMKLVVLSINAQLNLKVRLDEFNPNIQGDAWVGGIYRDNIRDEFREHVTNIDKNFRGCLSNLALNIRATFSIYDAIERVGVTPGCSREAIQNIEVGTDDYITVATGLPNVGKIAGLTSVRTGSPDGTILSADEDELNGAFVKLSMRDGHIVLSDRVDEAVSVGTYNDSKSHTIKFEKLPDGTLKLNIDNTDKINQPPRELLPESNWNYNPEDERAKKRRRRAKRRKTMLNALFEKSRVHVYIGGAPQDTKFVGCIGNIRIDGDPWHTGLLTEGLRCGLRGNARCIGSPAFNKCTASQQEMEVVAKLAQPGDTHMQEIEDDSNSDTTGTSRRQKKGKRRRKPKHGNRRDKIVAIDSVQSFVPGYDENCYLPLAPATSGFYYPGDGYAKYSVSDFNPLNWRFSLRMRTEAKEGIIFFMCTAGCPEHVAVYLVRGRIALSVKFGSGRSRFKSQKRYNDGQWHDVTFQRKAQNLQLIVDDTIINTEFYESSYTFTSFMLFYVGGLQVLEKRDALEFMSDNHLVDFSGCIQNLQVNDNLIETATSSALLKINLQPCFEGQTESGMFFPDANPAAIEQYYLLVHNTYNVGTNIEVSMEIRPRSQSGVLFAVGSYSENYFQLLLVEGRVVARVRQETDTLMSVYDPRDYNHTLCDGSWHKVKVIKAKNILTLNVDGNQVYPIEQGNIDIVSCETDGPMYVGGLPDAANVGRLLTVRRQYTGCMRRVSVDFFPVSVSTAIMSTAGVSANTCPLY